MADSPQRAKDLFIYANEEKQAIYRFYDADSVLLYIGLSYCPFNRYGQHKELASWFSERVALMKIEWVGGRDTVEVLEKAYIAAENPLFNKVRKKHWTHGEINRVRLEMLCHMASKEAIEQMLSILSTNVTGKYGDSRWAIKE